MNITVHIERLILDGLPITPGQRSQVQAAVEAELVHLFTTGGLSSSLLAGGTWPYVAAGDIQLANDDTPSSLGRRIARTVYTGIGGTNR
jgi:hypothetical protein